ncbi:MAG: hypothetical protein CVU98_12385 [Firmicutes bacterium HGW-Firmicutes-3]|jgi:hypothetical protein|nr:MAG: hypothetical protein CVU98_12385 [Firmicutes bacterium HGW-Firmicutes-3]
MILDKGSFNGLGTGLESVQKRDRFFKILLKKFNKILKSFDIGKNNVIIELPLHQTTVIKYLFEQGGSHAF